MKNTLKFLMLCFCGLLLLSSLSINNVSFADQVISEQTLPEPEKQATQPTKENFQTAWEAHIKSLPTTVTFEKTDEPNIYNYETTLFPYNGKLRLNNVVINKELDYYYDYDLGVENAIKGVAEVTLLSLSGDDLYKKYPSSYQLWSKDQYLFFDSSAGTWISAKEWGQTHAGLYEDTYDVYDKTSCGNACQIFKEVLLETWPFLIILLFLIIFMLKAKKTQKDQIEKFDLSIERQLEALNIQKQAMDEMKQQTKLLKQLADDKDQA